MGAGITAIAPGRTGKQPSIQEVLKDRRSLILTLICARGPNDDLAQENLDLFHHIFNLSLDGKLFLAPIGSNPQRILDIGTGTGIWAIDVADLYPSASVVATDLSPIQPTDVPPNLEFQIDDFTLPWTFSKNTFDFVHARCIYGSVADYPSLYSSVLDHLKPGGWFEQTEISVIPKSEDDSIKGTSLESWGPIAWESGEKFGKSFKIAEESRDIMENAGFVNVQRKTFKWPIGPWPANRKMKEIGAYNRLGWDEGINGWAMFLMTKYLGVSCELFFYGWECADEMCSGEVKRLRFCVRI